jgi:hypothetical protein
MVCAITTMWREKNKSLDLRAFDRLAPHMRRVLSLPRGFEEAIVTRDQVVADVVTKTVYFSLALAAFAFVSMLLLTGLHP